MSRQIITILSDLGLRDASAGNTRAVLMQYAPEATIVDISHLAAPYDLQQAAYLLLSSYQNFPQHTIHLVAVDLFAGSKPGIVFAEMDGFYFVAPANGFLELAFGSGLQHARLGFSFDPPFSFHQWLNEAGNLIRKITTGQQDSLPGYEAERIPALLHPRLSPGGIECHILYVDRFENVVLDITREQFAEFIKDRPFRIKVMRMPDITRISSNYNDVEQGEPLCRFNDAGFLEIALNRAPAAALLGVGPGNSANLRYQTIRIFIDT